MGAPRVLTLLALLLGCRSATLAKDKMTSSDLHLTWSATPAGATLAVSYRVTNGGASDIYVADGLLESGEKVDRLIVMNGAPGVVRLVRGLVLPDAERVLDLPFPTVVKLAPSASLEATVSLPLPLVAWHNAGRVKALKPASTLTLEIATYLTPEGDPTWLHGAPVPAP